MKLFEWLGQVIEPVTKLIDDLTLSKEEKQQFKGEIARLNVGMAERLMEYEKQLLQGQIDIVKAEAQGESYLQRNWRPITMLVFLSLVVADQTGLLAFRLAEEAWALLQLGMGGYVVGRSVEKVAPSIIDAVSAKNKNGA